MLIIIVILFVPVLTGILLAANALLAPQRPDAQKLSTYECGYDTLRGQTRSPFTISFYLVSVLFLAFDVEVALLFPLAPVIGIIGQYTYWTATGFFLVLTLGFVVEIASGVLNFTDHSNQS